MIARHNQRGASHQRTLHELVVVWVGSDHMKIAGNLYVLSHTSQIVQDGTNVVLRETKYVAQFPR